MNDYLMPIKTAALFFPILALFLTVPFGIYQYRKYKYINKLRVIVVFSFFFYLICAYYMVILPMPKNRDVKSMQRADIEYYNLKPFRFIEDIKKETKVDFNNPSTFKIMLTERAFLQVVFNILLTIPLGIYLRYYFGKGFKETLLISFSTSLFFELTQLSGLYGIYNAPYRIFDVDDLFLNTLGGATGYLISPMLTFFLPNRKDIDRNIDLNSIRVSYVRRLLAYVIDINILKFLPFFKTDIRAEYGIIFIYFIIVPYFTNGKTAGLWVTNTQVKGSMDRIKFKEIFIRNGILFFGVIGLNRLLISMVEANQKTDLYYISSYIAIVQLLYFIYLAINFFGSIIRKDRFFYEKLSNTKIAIINEQEGS